MTLVFKSKDLMWDFVEKHDLHNYQATNSTATLVIGSLSESQLNDAKDDLKSVTF